jgi:hypothetical protein
MEYYEMNGERVRINYCGREAQERMSRNGWRLYVRDSYQETCEQLYERVSGYGYKQVKIYWCGTMVKGIHSYFAFAK